MQIHLRELCDSRALALAAFSLGVFALGCDDPTCDPAAIQSALDAAESGDVVELGPCTVVADLEMPAGVTLRGVDRERSVLEAASSVALRVSGDPVSGAAARVERLTVRSAGCGGIVAIGAGAVEIEDVTVEVTRGIGLGVDGLAQLTLTAVDVVGPLADGSSPIAVPLPPHSCDNADPATHGVLLVRVGDARLRDVTTRGFVAFGALFIESSTTWNGGASTDHVGVGLEVYGGSADLTDLTLARARQDIALLESFGGLFAGGAQITSAGLRVTDGEVFGLLHDDSEGDHVDLVVEGNGFAGVWSQDSASLRISGTGTSIRDNAFAGVAAFRVGAVELADARIEATGEGLIESGPTGSVRAADGLHLVDSPNATLARLALLDNGRVGLLADLGGASTAALALTEVRVRGTGDELGAVAQNGTIDPSWDAAIAREGATAINDAAFTDTLEIAGAVGPSCLPNTTSVISAGLSSLVP